MVAPDPLKRMIVAAKKHVQGVASDKALRAN
jgi:hypothetical protein